MNCISATFIVTWRPTISRSRDRGGRRVHVGPFLVLLGPVSVGRVAGFRLGHQPGAVELAGAEVAVHRRQPGPAEQPAEVAHRRLARHAGPGGDRRSGHHQRPETSADRGGHDDAQPAWQRRSLPACLGLRVAAADVLGEGYDGTHHVLDRLSRFGIGGEADEVAGMAGCIATPISLSALKPPIPGPWPARGSMTINGRYADRAPAPRPWANTRHPVVDRLRQIMAVQHQVEVEAEDVPHRVVLAFQEGVAALAQHVDEQHRALPRVERVGGPGETDRMERSLDSSRMQPARRKKPRERPAVRRLHD